MKIAIIGMGPRGLSALEQLILKFSNSNKSTEVEIIIFEISDMAGYGHVYSIDQPNTNWLNITERGLQELPARKEIKYKNVTIPAIDTFENSEYSLTPKDADENYPDIFPLRSSLGKYLSDRYKSIVTPLMNMGIVKLIQDEVVDIKETISGLEISTRTGSQYQCKEALLTIGHQPTIISDQIKTWSTHADQQAGVINIDEAYPIENIQQKLGKQNHAEIGLRGFGLASIDVIRAIVQTYGGRFEMDNHNMEILAYHPSQIPLKIVPFSLDGLPAVPKPYSPKLDQRYTPTPKALADLKDDIREAINGKKKSHVSLIEAMTKLIVSMYLEDPKLSIDKSKQQEIEKVLFDWISDDQVDNRYMTSPELSTYEQIRLHIAMSKGETSPNLDYFAGQVWRHCQPTLYFELSHSGLPDSVMTEIIVIDERLKRYSFGPPAASMQQIILLCDAGVLDLNYMNNPEILLSIEGWKLQNNKSNTRVTAMINTVIDSPEIIKITSPLIQNLLAKDKIQAIHRKLGIDTYTDGKICTPERVKGIPIYALGRIVKGSVIGVDAILECFGSRVSDWADACVLRIES